MIRASSSMYQWTPWVFIKNASIRSAPSSYFLEKAHHYPFIVSPFYMSDAWLQTFHCSVSLISCLRVVFDVVLLQTVHNGKYPGMTKKLAQNQAWHHQVSSPQGSMEGRGGSQVFKSAAWRQNWCHRPCIVAAHCKRTIGWIYREDIVFLKNNG